MNKTFCPSCGFKNVYEVVKPRFCSGCGSSLTSIASLRKNVEPDVEIEQESAADISTLDLNKLRREIVAESYSSKISLVDLWKSASPNDAANNNMSRPAANLPEGRELLKRNQADCAPSRTIEIDG